MKQYLDLLSDVLKRGKRKNDRTGVGILNHFGAQCRYDLTEGFPLVTTKRVFLKGITHELLWFLKGDTNIAYLNNFGVHIWDDWADQRGNLGPVYGKQWRAWDTHGFIVDQISDVIEEIKKNPNSRRLIVNAWNVGEIDQMALPPCHTMFQFDVTDGRLSCQLYQRSADLFLGVPFNIASYALLTHMMAHVTGLGVGDFIHTIGSVHIYLSHINQVKKQLLREPRKLPSLWLNPMITNIDDFEYEDIKIENYKPDKAISAPIAI